MASLRAASDPFVSQPGDGRRVELEQLVPGAPRARQQVQGAAPRSDAPDSGHGMIHRGHPFPKGKSRVAVLPVRPGDDELDRVGQQPDDLRTITSPQGLLAASLTGEATQRSIVKTCDR